MSAPQRAGWRGLFPARGPMGGEETSVGQSCAAPSWDGSPLTTWAEEQQQGEPQQQGGPSTTPGHALLRALGITWNGGQ